MEFSPLEITQREFGRKLRGLDPDEVHTFLEQVAEEMTRLLQQSTDQASLVQRLEAQMKVTRSARTRCATPWSPPRR